jgi:putative tricarboxylic transport membrane protein
MSRSGLTSAAKGELVFTSFLFLAGVVVIADTAALPNILVDTAVSPKVFAFAVGFMLAGLSLFQIFQVLRGKLGTPDSIEGGELSAQSNWLALAVAIASLLFYVFFVQLLGFIISAGVLFAGLAWALGAKNKVRLAIYAFGFSAILFFLFTQGLQLQLPLGFEFIPGNSPADVEW